MKSAWKITLGVAAPGIICAVWLLSAGDQARRSLEQTRNSLRQQGFRLDIGDFELTTSPEMRARASVLTSAVDPRSVWLGMRGDILLTSGPRSNTAPVLWQEQCLATQSSTNLWPELRDAFNSMANGSSSKSNWARAREAVLAGPLRFEPASLVGGREMMWPHLSRLRSFELALQARLLLDLHDGNCDEAWLELLASTRLVADWVPEPAAICQTVRCLLINVAYESTWEALQADCWNEEQLAQLQREWQAVDFFKTLPETAAFNRAILSAGLETGRQQPLTTGSRPPSLLSDPEGFYAAFRDRQRQIHYRREGSFADERAMLLFYRDRELELRRAAACSTWQEIRALPVITNMPTYRPPGQGFRGGFRQGGFGGTNRRQGLLARAAESEVRRRILVTAIALERYRLRHGAYPNALDELAPECCKAVPSDFIDGKPLRYCTTTDGHYVLYSVGLDGTDNGGNAGASQTGADLPEGPVFFDNQEGTDLVWPRPLTGNPVLGRAVGRGPHQFLCMARESWK
jgi:hypothetical protein